MSFRLAELKAKQSPWPRHKLGAVITKGGRILATGHNHKGYSKYVKHSATSNSIHAEEAAIAVLLRENRLHDLAGATLYVSRRTPGNRVALALPCSRCFSLIKAVGIKKVCYTTDEGTEEMYV